MLVRHKNGDFEEIIDFVSKKGKRLTLVQGMWDGEFTYCVLWGNSKDDRENFGITELELKTRPKRSAAVAEFHKMIESAEQVTFGKR